MTKPATVTTFAANEIKLLILTKEPSIASTDEGLSGGGCTRLFMVGSDALTMRTGYEPAPQLDESSSRLQSDQTRTRLVSAICRIPTQA